MIRQNNFRLKQLGLAIALACLLQLFLGGAAQAQTDCSTQTDLPQIECEVLTEIYYTMGGTGWYFTTWNHNQSPCSWGGVTCESGHVVGLNFYEENLWGTFPAEIENLTFLESMSVNESSAQVPPEFFNLTNIRSLSGHNGIFLQITPQLLNFPNLEVLFLVSDPGGLTGQPPIARAGALPAFLGQLTNLRVLTLWSLGFQGPIPSEIGNLANLEHLDLGSNSLTSPLPSSLQDLSNLTYFSLAGNQLTGPLPPEWVFLSQLEYLEMGWNDFSGTLPNGWGNLANLRRLGLHGNQLYSFIPPFWSRLTSLESVTLSNNSLNGPIPAEWGSFPNLEYIDLENNRFSGGVHPNLGDGVAFSGRRLRLANNHLNGEIPASWATGNLSELSIRDNCLTTTDLNIVALLDDLTPGWFDTQCLPIFIDGFDAGSANNWDRIVAGTP